jgi:hypothetical protein
VVKFLPEQIAEISLTAVKPVAQAAPPGAAFIALCAWAAVALAAGAWALASRDV